MFSRWFEKRNKLDPERAVSRDAESLRRLLQKGESLRDGPPTAIVELGFQVGLWNGNARGEAAELTIQCGAFSRRTRNRGLLRIIASDDERPDPELLKGALAALVEAWQPEGGEIFQLIAVGEDFDEFRCGGYSPSAPTGSVDAVPLPDGMLWFDEAAYRRFR